VRELRILLGTIAAVLLLNVSVTFSNWWPTPAIWWNGAPSVELAIVLLALVLTVTIARPRLLTQDGRFSGTVSRVLRWISIAWVGLVIGRYVDVTAPALWGRELNFYWDLRFLPDVAAMLVSASKRAVLAGSIAAIALILVLVVIYVVVRWSFAQVLRAVTTRSGRVAIGAVSSVAIVAFAMQAAGLFGVDLLGEEWRLFPRPVTQVYARQVRLVYQAVSRSVTLPPSPPLDVSLSRVEGADVFLFFLESYGAVTYENAAFNARLQQSRALLDTAIHDTGRGVVSGFVESPTFGGSSWFAHITFLSGLKVADPDTNALLMTEQRQTVVTSFANHGYRTLAVMPGLWYPWPEGTFYGFQDLYNGPRLNYKGPPFGWWDMPDEFTLAKLDEQEVAKADRRPLFVFYPTVSTHTPFSPVPPYQPDWPRMLTPTPFSQAELDRAYVGDPDYMNLGPGYVDAVAYTYQTFAGYVRQRAGRDYVMILLGDHQPPAIVSGEHASWDVPMHVITNRPGVLESLLSHGFVSGLTPQRPHIGEMHEVVPIVLDAMSGAPPLDAAMRAR
jgi:hypothetical protein